MERILDTLVNRIKSNIENDLNRCGFFYRIFARAKSKASIQHKIQAKGDEYSPDGKKMQDIIGIRVVFYFRDDVTIFSKYLQSKEYYEEKSVDNLNTETFKPERLNLIMRMPESMADDLSQLLADYEFAALIDTTYEIQIRTILSEGWHEVEHDLRYKCKEEWEQLNEEGRILNGIFASLQTSEWTMLQLFENISHTYYKQQKWSLMLKNKMRLRLSGNSLSTNIDLFLNNNTNFAKDLYRSSRQKLLSSILRSDIHMPLTLDTIVFLYNRIVAKDYVFKEKESSLQKELLDKYFPL